jgi:hypothetical protein
MSSRRKKREAQCPDENRPAAALPTDLPEEQSQCEYICEGCKRLRAIDKTCGIYAFVPPYYINQGCCYFNRPEIVAKKKKTQGQQKQGRNR